MKRFLSVLGFLFLIVLYGCTPKDIAISFETNGGNAIETITEFDPETPSLPTPVRVGYTFDGWFEDEDLTTEFDPLKARESWTFTLYAKWMLIPYDITIEHYQEDLFDAYVLFETETISDFDEVITDVSLWENDYSGFEANATSIIDDDDISDVTIKLYYDRITYTLTIDEAGGDLVPDIIAKYGYPILEPEMTRWAYTFSGWNVTFPETMPLNGGSITATWTPIPPVTVTFETNGGSLVPDFTAVPETEFNPPTPPTKLGYAFGGWFTDALLDEPFVFAPLGHEDITIYAKWNPINVDYTVDYYFESLLGDYLHLETLELQALTDSTVTHVGLDRPGFSENTTHANRISVGVIAADGSTKLSIYYDRNDYTLSFDSNADLSITSITGPFESVITEPSDPTRSGYSFMGWYADEALTIPFVFNTMPFENTTVYAKWEGIPTDLFFDSHGGTMVSPIHAPLDSVITPPANPTKEGYHFAGWYLHEDLVNAFTDWVMPFGSITLHAKWTPNDYTVSFDENGGSLVTDITAPYLSNITAPANPTKTDYVFSGWYSDLALTQAFTFTTMPLSGITLYAKWISLEEATQLQNIIHLAEGTFIQLEATIYAMQYGDYQGFYVFDSTGFIFIHASKSGLEVGDIVSLTGVLHFWNDVPVIGNVANLLFISALNPLSTYTDLVLDVAMNTTPSVEIYSSIGATTGVLVLENGIYRIYNPATQASVAIAPQFVNKTELDLLVGSIVDIDFLYESYLGEWRIGYTDIQDTMTTDEAKTLMIEDWIKSLYQSKTYYPNEYFEFPSEDPYSWGSIQLASTTQNELQLNPTSLQFLATDIAQLVTIPVTVTINATVHTFDLTVILNPLEITSIYNFLLTVARGQSYHIQGEVVLVYEDWNYCLLDDGTASVMIYCEDYTYGDELLVSAIRMLGNGYIEINQENLLAIRLISRNNSLDNPAELLNPLEIPALDSTDSSLYGKYVEIRGFLLQSSMDSEYHHYFSITDNQTFSLPVEPIGYAGFEQLFNYVGLEVIIRGYLFEDYSLETGFSLGFLGIREDIKLPNYTDEERINMIQTLFASEYAGETFHPFDAFPLYPHHPILGADISWVFTNGSDAYFDFDTETFKFVDVSTPISINITITKNAFSATYTYTTTLEPLDYSTVSEIKEMDLYYEVYVKGLVVFRDPDFLYIQDETGLLRVESYSDLNCYKGDIVVLWGIKFLSESYNQRGMTYLSNDRDEKQEMVISILSRDNPVVIDQSELSLNQVVDLDPLEPNSYTQYVTLSGRLTDSVDHYGYYELSMGLNSVLISALDDYTWYKMELLLDTHERSVDVTLDLFLNDYDFDYQHWMLIYTGQTETAYPIFTDLDRADLIEEWLIDSYNTNVFANQSSFTFAPTYPATFTNSITYVTHGDYAAVIDVVNGIIHDVPVTTNVLITATFTVGAITRDVELVMTVVKDNDVSTTVSLISDFIASNSTEVQKIVGLIIAIASIENGGYAFIVEDPSGTLIVRMPSNYWYWDYNMVGKELTATGTHVLVDGRHEMIATSTTIGVTAFTIIENFEPYTFGELSSIDLLNTELIGQPMQLTGRLIRDDYGRYYLTDGLNQVILNFTYPMSNELEYYKNLNVTINGFFLGNWMNGKADMLSFTTTSRDYGSGANLVLAENTDMDFAQAILAYIQRYQAFGPFHYGDLVVTDSYFPSFFGTATINYTLISGNEFVSFFNGVNMNFALMPNDGIVEVLLSVTYGTVTLEKTLLFPYEGYAIGTLEDLFAVEDGTLDIALHAYVLHSGWGWAYFVVDGYIYYLEDYEVTYDLYPYMECMLLGKKTIVDGKPNYTYQLLLEDFESDPYTGIDPILMMTINEIYAADLTTLPLNNWMIQVQGQLMYDKYLDQFYLTDGTQKLYIRENLEIVEEEYYYYEEGPTYLDLNVLYELVGDQVIMRFFFPLKYTMLDYYMVDFRGLYDDFMIPDLTPQEHATMAANKAAMRLSGMTFTPGDSLFDYFPWGDEYHNAELDFTVQNATDALYFDFNNGGFVKIIPASQDVIITVTATRYDYEWEGTVISTASADFTVHLEALDTSTVREVLWGEAYKSYILEGVVEMHYFDLWIILSDGSGRIYIDAYGYNSYYDIPEISNGDLIQILGRKEFYEGNDYVPVMGSVLDINVISGGHPISNTPTAITVQEILDLDYLSPDAYNQYVIVTGDVIRYGSDTYPGYEIHQAGTPTDRSYNIQLYADTYMPFNDMMLAYVGDVVTLEGYLIGFEYIYDRFDWIVIYVDHEVVTDN